MAEEEEAALGGWLGGAHWRGVRGWGLRARGFGGGDRREGEEGGMGIQRHHVLRWSEDLWRIVVVLSG